MTEAWFKLVQFLTGQFGLPGSLALAILCYVMFLLREERQAHEAARDKIDAINEKRIELNATYMLAIKEMGQSLQAVQALFDKVSEKLK